MRGWSKTRTTVAAALVVLAAGLSGCGEDAPPLSAKACRAAWENLHQTQGENGSLAPDDTATTARWDQEWAAAAHQSKHPDDLDTCRADVRAATERFERLIDLSVAIRDHDMADRLAFDERALEHAVRMRDYDPLPPRLARAFQVLRAEAPAVHAAVAEAEQKARDVDLDDRGAVKALAERIEAAATSVPGYAACLEADEEIGRFELDEE